MIGSGIKRRPGDGAAAPRGRRGRRGRASVAAAVRAHQQSGRWCTAAYAARADAVLTEPEPAPGLVAF